MLYELSRFVFKFAASSIVQLCLLRNFNTLDLTYFRKSDLASIWDIPIK